MERARASRARFYTEGVPKSGREKLEGPGDLPKVVALGEAGARRRKARPGARMVAPAPREA